MPYLIADNWLYTYAELEGIARVLGGMNRRTGNRSGMHRAISDLELHYDAFGEEFRIFFEDLRKASTEKLNQLENNHL